MKCEKNVFYQLYLDHDNCRKIQDLLIMNDKKGIGLFRGKILWIVISLSAVLITGGFLTWWTINHAERFMRNDFLQSTRLIAQTIDRNCVKNLLGTQADLASYEYLQIKDQFIAARTAYPKCRFLYLMGRRDDGKVFFYIDSEPVGSKDESPAGQIYEEASQDVINIFVNRKEDIIGPATDRWGTWVSALIPIEDDVTGELIAVLGMDIDGRDWKWEALHEGLAPILVTIILVVIILIGSAMLAWRKNRGTGNPRVLRYIEPGIACAIGLTLTFFSALTADKYEANSYKETYYHLLNTKTMHVTSVLETLKNVELEALSSIFSLRQHVTNESFYDYTKYLAKNSAIQAMEWVPVVPEVKKAELEQWGRKELSSDYEIWEKDSSGNRVPAKGRPFYYPIYFMTSFVGNEPVPGFDLGSEPDKAKALEDARRTGLTLCTDPIPLEDESGKQDGILVLRPVFSRDEPDLLLGFAAATVRMGTLLKTAAASGIDNTPVSMDLFMLHKSEPAIRIASISAGEVDKKKNESFSIIRPIFIFGRTFTLVARPGSELAALHPARYVWIFSLAGLLITTAIVIVIVFIVHRREDLEILVQKRTIALQESEEIFSCFMKHNPIYVFIKDKNIRPIRLSSNYEQMLGMPIDEILGKRLDEVFPSDLAKSMIANDKRILEEGKQITVEEELNGRFYETIIFPILIGGKAKYLAGYTLDITERKKTKEKIESNVAFLETLLNTIPSPIFYTDKEGRYQGGNSAWTDGIIGLKTEEIIGHTIDELCKKISKDFADEHNRKDLELIKTGGTQVYESIVKYNDEKDHDFIFYKSTFPNAEGEIAGIVGVMLDITERNRAEEEKTMLYQRLQQAQKMEAIGTLAGGIAHDFNNILMPILAFSELTMMTLPPDSPLQYNIQQIQKAAARAKDIVRQILTFARQQERERIPIKISQILKETIKLLRSSIPSTINIRCDINTEKDTVLADPTQLSQIIMNLSTNAVHAMEDEGGTLEIILMNEDLDTESAKDFSELEPGQYVKLSVKDTGHGIKPQIMDKIFEPYFTTKTTGKGTGIGLSIVHGIVKNYGGEITVQSEVSKGTSFHIYLPLIEDDSGVHETVRDKVQFKTGKERILIIDDDKVSLDAIQSMLEWLGYKVTGRTSSIEALEAFRHNPKGFDLVITDQTMPNMTGKNLAKALMTIRSDIPVILCTGFSEQIDEKRSKEMGIKAFVMKPIVIGQIADTIRDVLDKNG